jgi:3D (Asp-Asp-Asp) domain-containing protein
VTPRGCGLALLLSLALWTLIILVARVALADDRWEVTVYRCYHSPCRTATGTVPRWGVVAVDPSVIPLGSRVRIEGLGEFIAEDTGAAVRGRVVDVYWDAPHDLLLKWGRRKARVEVLR